MNEAQYINKLFTDWCECSPYEQVPDEWPELMAAFVREHAGSIFRTAAAFVLHDLANAVYDKNQQKLGLIGIPEPA